MVDHTGNIHSVVLIDGYFARLLYVCMCKCVHVCVCMCSRDQADCGLYRKH